MHSITSHKQDGFAQYEMLTPLDSKRKVKFHVSDTYTLNEASVVGTKDSLVAVLKHEEANSLVHQTETQDLLVLDFAQLLLQNS